MFVCASIWFMYLVHYGRIVSGLFVLYGYGPLSNTLGADRIEGNLSAMQLSIDGLLCSGLLDFWYIHV